MSQAELAAVQKARRACKELKLLNWLFLSVKFQASKTNLAPLENPKAQKRDFCKFCEICLITVFHRLMGTKLVLWVIEINRKIKIYLFIG